MDNLERKIEKGSLYKLDKNLKLSKVDKNYRITNGPAFINKKCFYHTDSKKKIVYKIYIDKFWRPSTYKMINHQTGKSTDLFVENIKFKEGLSERDFNQKSLSRVR